MVKSKTRNVETDSGAKIPRSRSKKHESIKDAPEMSLGDLFSDSVAYGTLYDKAVGSLERTYNMRARETIGEIITRYTAEIEILQAEVIELQDGVNARYETIALRLVSEYNAGTVTSEEAASICGLLSRTPDGPDMPYFDIQRASEWSQPFRDAQVGRTVLGISYVDISGVGNGGVRNYSTSQTLRDSPVVGILAAPPTLDLGDNPEAHNLQPKITYELQSGDIVSEDLGMRVLAGPKADDFVGLWLSRIGTKKDEETQQNVMNISPLIIRKVSQDFFRLKPLSDTYTGLKDVEAALKEAITTGLTSDMREWSQYIPTLSRLSGFEEAMKFIPSLMGHYIVREEHLDPTEIVAAALLPTHDVVDRYTHPDEWSNAEAIVNRHRVALLKSDEE